ncbi:6-bladed beta-propeller [Pedosphaera parvula]|uniref:NHL repeat containing protein n=1 Tax=Pedosphaera parvula (strain Ellin514) TaxID=320771 RepID=B9XSA9_PEDPL|nr:6-bladed beta-propeller [Pedosphaera parvula]EEF57279.1 NHL repeat containing protein [Pedosphaera parvula Ellin514]
MNWTLLQNSLLVSGLTTLLSVTLGFGAALWLAGLERTWRMRWLAIAIFALALPPFLVTNCWLYYLGQAGVWHRWLPLNIFTLGGTVWILALLTWPITLLATLGAWQRLEAAQLESDMAVTGTAFIRGLLLPLARNIMVQAGVLTFALALNNFAVPAILQVKVFPAEVWVEFNTSFNTMAALQQSWPMILVPLLLLLWFKRRNTSWPTLQSTVSAKLFRRQLGKRWFYVCGIGTFIVIALSAGLPIFQLISAKRTWTELHGAVAAGQGAIWTSFWLAAVSATLCLVLSLVGWRLPVGLVLWLPFLVPGVLLGIAFIFLFNRPWLSAFYQSVGIVILAYCIRYLAFGWNGVAHARHNTDPNLNDAARVEGASWWQLLCHVQWPQIGRQVMATWYVIFLLCLWDVESIVLVVPPGGETLALRTFNLLHFGHNAQVNALCLTLLVLAIVPLILWQAGRLVSKWINIFRRAGAMAIPLISIPLLVTGCSGSNSTERSIESKFFSRVQVIGTRGAGIGEFNKPRSVAVDKQDNLYVVDMTGRVQKFSPEGKFLLFWQMPQTDLGKPKGMCCDKEGNIVVLEPHYQRVNHFSPEGKLIAQWGSHGTNASQLTLPRCVAVNSHNDVLVTEYTLVDRVQQFSARGQKLINCFGQAGEKNGEFNRPEGMDVDASDRMYIADSCNHRIQVFSAEGKWLRTYGKAGTGLGEMSYPYDIRVDKAGRQYVCEFGNSRIQIFDANDKPLEVLGGVGGAPGEFSNPWSIAFDSKGNLYVADSQNHRVQKFLRKTETASLNLKGGVNR